MGIILFSVIIGIFIGVVGGLLFSKLKIYLSNKKITNNAEDFINGKYENVCEIEGEKVKCDKFIIPGKNKDIKIKFENGKQIEEERKVEEKSEKVDFKIPKKTKEREIKSKKTNKKTNQKATKKNLRKQ